VLWSLSRKNDSFWIMVGASILLHILILQIKQPIFTKVEFSHEVSESSLEIFMIEEIVVEDRIEEAKEIVPTKPIVPIEKIEEVKPLVPVVVKEKTIAIQTASNHFVEDVRELVEQRTENLFKDIEMKPVKAFVVPPKPVKTAIQSNASQGAIVEAKVITHKCPPPVYPQMARRKNWEGLTLLKVTVESNGFPSSVKVVESSGHRMLDQRAVKAYLKCEFKPATLGGVPVTHVTTIPVEFKLISN